VRITDEQQFEAALEEATKLMESPGAGSGEDQRLQALLDAIDGYRPTFADNAAAARSEQSDRASRLVRQAADLKTRFDAERRKGWESFPDDGRGIGPTTGV
jgi:hypothetical protein